MFNIRDLPTSSNLSPDLQSFDGGGLDISNCVDNKASSLYVYTSVLVTWLADVIAISVLLMHASS